MSLFARLGALLSSQKTPQNCNDLEMYFIAYVNRSAIQIRVRGEWNVFETENVCGAESGSKTTITETCL